MQIDYSEVSDRRFLEIIDEGAEAGVCEWAFIGGGEPMVRGELLMKLCAKIKERNMSGYIQTNGSMLNKERMEHLVNIGWDALKISLDGPNAEINDTIRCKSSFEKAVNNLKCLESIKKDKGAAFPNVHLYSVITNLTYNKLDQMVDLVHDVGGSSLEVVKIVDNSDLTRDFKLNQQQEVELPAYVKKALDKVRDLKIQTNLGDYLIEAAPKQGIRPVQPESISKRAREANILNASCYLPWFNMIIPAHGRCGPCCAYDDSISDESNDINNKSLMDVWSGQFFQDLRKRMINHNRPAFCGPCPSTLVCLNESIRRESLSYHSQVEFAVLPLHGKIKQFILKSANSIKKHGPLTAIKRGIQWIRIINR